MVRFEIDSDTCNIQAQGNIIDLELSLLAYAICRNDSSLNLFTKLVEHVTLIAKEKEKHGKI